MCKAFEDMKLEGVSLGIEQGIEIFILDNQEEGVPKDRILAKLEKRFQLTEEQAKSYFQRFGNVL